MTNSKKANKEKDDFFKFQKHLCNKLMGLKRYHSSVDFLKEQNKKVVDDFFFSNLFMLHHSTLNLNVNQQIRDDIKNMWNSIKLYHYTDSPSLEKIILGQSLKLNSILNMNDSGEGQALIENIRPLFDKYQQDQNIFDTNTANHVKNLYAASFTTLNDDASQWARYGTPKKYQPQTDHKPTEIEEEPCGVCLEIPIQNLLNLVDTIKDDFDLAVMAPVLYVPDNHADNTFLKFIKAIINLRLKKENSSDFTKYVSHYSAAIKHESFKKEYEVRFLLSITDNMAKKLNYIEHISSTKDRYIIFKLAKRCQNFSFTQLFSSITVGPGTSPEAKRRVENLLRNHNLPLYPKDSKCTLHA